MSSVPFLAAAEMNVTAAEAICCGCVVMNVFLLFIAAVMFSDGGGQENVMDDKLWEGSDSNCRNPMNTATAAFDDVVIRPPGVQEMSYPRITIDSGWKSGKGD